MTLLVNGLDILARGFGETLLLVLLAELLEVAECGGIFFALAAETGFLNGKIIELALVSEEDFGFYQVLADFSVLVWELGGEFEAADGIDAQFESGNAEQAPFGVG